MEFVKTLNDIIWSPALVVLLVGAGLYLSAGTRFVQIRKIGTMLRLLSPKGREKKEPCSG